jgi:hypothetical protein
MQNNGARPVLYQLSLLFFAGQMVAMAECNSQGCGSGLKYLLTDP